MKVRELLNQIENMRQSDPAILDADVQLVTEQDGAMVGMFPDRVEWQFCRSAKMSALRLYHQKHEGWQYRWAKSLPKDLELRFWNQEKQCMDNKMPKVEKQQ